MVNFQVKYQLFVIRLQLVSHMLSYNHLVKILTLVQKPMTCGNDKDEMGVLAWLGRASSTL